MSVISHRISKYSSRASMRRCIGIVLAVVLLCLGTDRALGAGTPAGTVIQTRSTAVYTTATGMQIDTSYSPFVSVTVLQQAAVNLTPAALVQTSPGGGTTSDVALTLTNSGNGSDKFQLTAQSLKGWTTALYADANGDGVLQSNELASGPLTQTPNVAADASFKFILRLTSPSGQSVDGQKDTTIVDVRSAFSSSTDVRGTYVTAFQSALLTGTLTVSNPSPAGGTNVTYTAVFTNSGSKPADNITVSNLLNSALTYVSSSGGVVNSTVNPITWTVGTLNPGASATLVLTVRVNANVPVGTIVNDQMTATYSAGSGAFTSESNLAQITVSAPILYGVTITPLSLNAVGEATDTITYRYMVKNIGRSKDAVVLHGTSSNNDPWAIYRDANANGIWDASDPLVSGGMSSAGAQLDSVAAGDSVRIVAMTILPKAAYDQVKDTLRITAVSAGGGASDAAVMVTTTNAPVVAAPSMSIFPTGNHPAGTELTYTIAYANTGHAAVDNFSVIGTAPVNTQYMINSVKVDGVTVADNEGAVRVGTDSQSNTVITVSVGRLGSSKNGSVEFKVKVK